MEVGHGEGCWVVLAQRKPERKRGQRVCVGEEEEERPGRKAGEGSRDGWRRDRVFKREGNAVQRPRAPLPPSGSGGAGGGHSSPGGRAESGAFGGSAGGGEGAGYQGCSAPILPGCRRLGAGCPQGAWLGGVDNPAPSGLILQPWRKTTPKAAGSGHQPRQQGSSQFKEAKVNLLCGIEASPLPLQYRAARLSSLLNSLFKIEKMEIQCSAVVNI